MKGVRGKENRDGNRNGEVGVGVGSTYRVESDQKELILKALRGEHEGLKKNESDYHKMHDSYKQLQHKFKLLSEEKNNEDRDFKMRHEAALRSISQLRNEIDALKAELRDKKLEINDLDSDSAALNHQLDEKNIELDAFRNDYKGCLADAEELNAEKESLANAAAKLTAILAQLQEEDRLLKEDNDSVGRRLQELEKYHEQLLLQEKILREKIQGYENENNELDAAINELCDSLADLELAIKKAQQELAELHQAVAELSLAADKYKAEALHAQKATQAEIAKNNSLLKNLKNAEYTHKVRLGQVEQGEREVAGLKEEKDALAQINSKLAEDLEACRAHLENLGLINTKVLLFAFSSFTTSRIFPARTSPSANC